MTVAHILPVSSTPAEVGVTISQVAPLHSGRSRGVVTAVNNESVKYPALAAGRATRHLTRLFANTTALRTLKHRYGLLNVSLA